MKKYYAIRQLLLPLFILLLLHCQGANAQGIYPDPSFGNNGLMIFPKFGPASTILVKVLPFQAGSSILIYRNSDYVYVMKYLPTGGVDSSFVTIFRRYYFKDVAIDFNGRIVIAGARQGLGARPDLDVFRLTADGAIDTSFYFDGGPSAISNFSFDFVTSFCLQGDKVVIAGLHNYLNIVGPSFPTTYDVTILGPSGNVVGNFGLPVAAESLTAQGDKLLVQFAGGNTISRYTMQGILDSSFGSNGSLPVSGKIVLDNDQLYVLTNNGILRFDANGRPDSSFNGTGVAAVSASALAFYDNKLIVAGYNTLTRIHIDGGIDSSFGNNGVFTTGNLYTINSLLVDSNVLYLTGYHRLTNEPDSNLAIAAYIFDATPTFKCPESRRVMVDAGQCNAIVYGIDPLLNNGITMSRMKFRLQGATAAFGTGTASGQSFNAGTTRVSYIIDNNEASECSFEVLVLDAQPPSITNAYAWPPVLWPPNHTLRKVDINYLLHDNCGAVSSLSVTSDEPAGNNDWQIKDSHTLYLRATRNGNGQGRKYTITIHAIDKAGNTTAKNVWVVVPQHLIGKFDKIKPLSFTATPNPSSNYFNIATQSSSEKPVTIKISDIQGRVVMVKANLPANTVVQIGAGLARGIYLAECTQGNERVVLKLIKLG